jgi:hypothetical protein
VVGLQRFTGLLGGRGLGGQLRLWLAGACRGGTRTKRDNNAGIRWNL